MVIKHLLQWHFSSLLTSEMGQKSFQKCDTSCPSLLSFSNPIFIHSSQSDLFKNVNWFMLLLCPNSNGFILNLEHIAFTLKSSLISGFSEASCMLATPPLHLLLSLLPCCGLMLPTHLSLH